MQNNTITGLLASGLSAFILTASCGGPSKPRKRVIKPADNAPQAVNDVPNLSGNQEALALIQNLSANDSASAPTECIHILTQSPQDLEWKKAASTHHSEMQQFYCSLDEASLSRLFHNKISNSSHSNDNGGIDAGFPIEGIPISIKLNASSVRGKEYTQDMATQDASSYKKQVCSENENLQNSGRSEQVLRKFASSVTLDKFNQCITVRQRGFYCQIAETSEGVAAVVRWEPNEVVRKHLPKVSLNFATTENLELASQSVPQVLGIGTGQAISYRRKNPEQGSLLQIVANDAGHAVSLACSRTLPPTKKDVKKVWSQHSYCGTPIAKSRDVMQSFEEIDMSRPEQKTIPGAIKPEYYKGHIPCGHNNPYNGGRTLCTDQKLVFVAVKYATKTCWIQEGLYSRESTSSNVYATCRDPDTKETYYPHKKTVERKVGAETKEVTRACEIDADIPGVKEISSEQAKKINDVTNFNAN